MTQSTFESCLTRYHVIGQRLLYSNFVLDRLAPKLDPAHIRTIFTEDEKEEAKKLGEDLQEYALTSRICFDFNVVQLYSLLEAHQEIKKYLTTQPRIDLENYLEDVWKEVKNQKNRICKWRNNFVAHGKSFSQDGTFIVVPDLDPVYLQGQIDLFRVSKCAVIYIHGFLINTPEYPQVLQNYQSETSGMKSMTSYQYSQIDITSVLQGIKKKLKEKGLDDDIKDKLYFV